jgi:hypothetical protein
MKPRENFTQTPSRLTCNSGSSNIGRMQRNEGRSYERKEHTAETSSKEMELLRKDVATHLKEIKEANYTMSTEARNAQKMILEKLESIEKRIESLEEKATDERRSGNDSEPRDSRVPTVRRKVIFGEKQTSIKRIELEETEEIEKGVINRSMMEELGLIEWSEEEYASATKQLTVIKISQIQRTESNKKSLRDLLVKNKITNPETIIMVSKRNE